MNATTAHPLAGSDAFDDRTPRGNEKRLGRAGRLQDIDFDELKQYAATIESELDLEDAGNARDDASTDPATTEATRRIREKLDEVTRNRSLELNWSTVYHAEKLMLDLFSDHRTGLELQRRISMLSDGTQPFAAFYRGAVSDAAGVNDVTEKAARNRYLLLSLVSDVQRHNCRRFIKMRYARLAIYKVGASFVLAFAIFLCVLTVGHWL